MGFRKLSLTTACSCTVVVLCLMVCLGWQYNIAILRSILPGVPETTPLTAMLLLLLGFTLALTQVRSKHATHPTYISAYQIIIIVVLLIALFTGIQYLFNLSPSIETIFFPEKIKVQNTAFSGRPSGRTVITLILSCAALFFAYSKKRNLQNIAIVSSLMVLVLPWIALFGYSTATVELYLIPEFPETGMSPITAVAFIVLSIGIMDLWPNKGLMALFRSTTQSARMSKTLVLIVILIPFALNWVVHFYIENGQLDVPINFAFEWGFFILLLAGVIIWGGILINKRDLEKEELHDSLRQAEEQFRTLIELAPDAMIIANGNADIILINEKSRKLFGYTEDEMLGMPIQSLLPDQFLNFSKELRNVYFQSAQTRTIGDKKTMIGVKKSGEEFPIEIGLSPIKIKSELMISAIVRDISKRIQAEDEIKSYIRNLGLVKKIARIGYYETDSGLDRFEVSENLCNMFGASKRILSREEMRGLLHPDDLKKFKGILDRALEKEENFELEFRIINPLTHETFQVKNFNYFSRDSLGNIQVLGLMQDITQEKKVQNDILKLNKSLEQKVKDRTAALKDANDNLEKTVKLRTEQLEVTNKELESFSYSVSHDLRAPLRAITGFSSFLQRDFEASLGDEGKRFLSIIVRNTSLMGQLIDDILVFSRLNRSELATTQLNLKTIFNTVYLRLLEEKENKGRNIEFIVDNLPHAQGDRAMITQVIVNLVSNALKYTETKEKTHIHVGCQNINDSATYFIKDNGVGFDERHKSKLFKVFQRLHNERDFRGTGIGLAIVKRVITKHGGKVWGESVLNEGATFYFTLT
ncbi:MAG TPA: PAS domain S-box protein [Pricia antarctica]|uniref:histidine kinase n=3 Tax=root TaxID=1 RepID=A0A831QML1_9FLAO|nr:PAS domain S-box protein [Pricia antarctica]